MIKCGAKIMTIKFERIYRNYLPTKEQNKELVEIKLVLKNSLIFFQKKSVFFFMNWNVINLKKYSYKKLF